MSRHIYCYSLQNYYCGDMITYELWSYPHQINELDHPNVYCILSSTSHIYMSVSVCEGLFCHDYFSLVSKAFFLSGENMKFIFMTVKFIWVNLNLSSFTRLKEQFFVYHCWTFSWMCIQICTVQLCAIFQAKMYYCLIKYYFGIKRSPKCIYTKSIKSFIWYYIIYY